ncbi:hypothetical protein [Nocardia transvalensis]|uniref:hypothetical protein n=1 Tax=Nocardia transvalensis TaxID=37333 RepID=UPI0018956241|nr:hypothetical protein [Nocardia transvalensis]MBF6333548.1 hypothetical protein [Nocardia transvalensis]
MTRRDPRPRASVAKTDAERVAELTATIDRLKADNRQLSRTTWLLAIDLAYHDRELAARDHLLTEMVAERRNMGRAIEDLLDRESLWRDSSRMERLTPAAEFDRRSIPRAQHTDSDAAGERASHTRVFRPSWRWPFHVHHGDPDPTLPSAPGPPDRTLVASGAFHGGSENR